jgi:hypothetical protein
MPKSLIKESINIEMLKVWPGPEKKHPSAQTKTIIHP